MMHSAVSVLDPPDSPRPSPPPIHPEIGRGLAPPPAPAARSREVVPGLEAESGSFFVEPDRPARLELSEGDAVVFGRGAALVDVPGRVQELIDPLCAVWCRSGYTLHWVPFGDARVRLDWFTPGALAAGIEPWSLERREPGDEFPYRIYHAGAQLFLAQRLLADLREIPVALRSASGGPLVLPPMELSTSAWSRLFAPARGDNQDLVRAVRKLLATSFRRATSVPALSRRVGYSSAHVSRIFKHETGLSILAYRHELRMRAALGLLGREEIDLAELALELGYGTHSHFTARFKRTFGLTPSRYRRLARAGLKGRPTAAAAPGTARREPAPSPGRPWER